MKILIVDDHDLFRRGVSTVLKSSISPLILLEAENGEKALEVMRNQILDLVILDISMPVMDGIEVLRYLQKAGLKSFKILVLTLYTEPVVVYQLLELGCEGYMPKNRDAEELIEVVNKVLSGELSYPKEFDEKIIQLIQFRKISTQTLSVNEIEIIRLISLGMNSKQIATSMRYTVRTVETKKLRM